MLTLRAGAQPSVSPEARNPSLSPPPECLLHQLNLTGRIYPPERSLARLLLGARHFDKISGEIFMLKLSVTASVSPGSPVQTEIMTY